MSYTINLTNGNVFAVIPDGTINSTSSMTLIGKNYAGYGQFLDDNFIHLLECGSNSTAPTSPLVGQLWYDSTNTVLKVYKGSTAGWKPITATTAASSAPSNNVAGDLWYDSGNVQLNVYSGNSWITVGPAYNANVGVTGAIPATIVDSTSASHVVTELYVANVIVGIVSKDATFQPQTTISGFANVYPGITLTTAGSNSAIFAGTATNASNIGGIAAANIAVTNAPTTFNANVAVSSANVLSLNNILNNSTSATGNIGNASAPFNTFFGTATTANNALYLGGYSANTYVTTTAAAGIVTLQGILNANASGVGNVGNTTTPFNTIFAKATSAQYADLAERFATDVEYEAGTVVELGGSAEITKVTAELSDTVFGVISTRAAYLMNGGAGTDATHPPVAMTGRVPVKVTGSVLKGDRLVSAGNGIARAAQPGEATAFNVIGRALVSKLDTGLGTVEAIVTIK